MTDERTTPAFLPSAAPRDGRPAFARPPVPAARPSSSSDPGAEAVDSHARPIAMPESAQRPAITPAPATRLSSRPPPLPPPAFFPPPHDSDDQNLLAFEDSLDERTPVSVTKPSLPYEALVQGTSLPAAPAVVVIDSLEAFDPLLAPLPPPAVIEPPAGGYRTSFGSDGAPSSGPASSGRLPTSVAPPMPQIPKPVSSGRPFIHAPGIVSTQAIPLTVPAKKRGRSPLFVAFAAALVGGIIALAIGLSMKPKAKADAGTEAPTAAPAPTAIEATRAAAASAASAASSAPADSGASAVAAAPASSAAPRQTASTSAASAPPATPPRPPRKSDRIED